ncbi:hypothetical protein HY638_01915 [Candidatus Woesearchaeota archaeon]|nr:hypothetical protein [Candidatus Woesearchaeota archaeon]
MEENDISEDTPQQGDLVGKITIGLLVLVAIVTLYNIALMSGFGGNSVSGASVAEMSMEQPVEQSGNSELQSQITPKGIPDIYGKELGVSFDDVSADDPKKADATLGKMGTLDRQITLSGDNQKRYISIASKISCEYCCGADSVITSDGKAACGCSHSAAMRGIAKYLIKNHPTEYTDDQILEEMGKWKTLSFPGKISAKAEVLQGKGIELNYINLASNKYRGIENEAAASGSGMVGGC